MSQQAKDSVLVARARFAWDGRRISIVQILAGAILLAVSYFTFTAGEGATVHPVCAALVCVCGLALSIPSMMTVFKALLSQYGHFRMPVEEALFALYEFRISSALALTGFRLLIHWWPLKIAIDLCLAAILFYCAFTRLSELFRDGGRNVAEWLLGCVMLALCAIAAGVLVYGTIAGLSWTVCVSVAAIGFALDSLWCALASYRTLCIANVA